MAKLYVIQTGQTAWEPQQRMESAAGLPLTQQGAAEVALAARQLSGRNILAVHAGDGEAERQSAGILAGVLGVKVRIHNDLREFDYGLWQGLTMNEIKRRSPKVYRQWREAPSGVCPPGGETLAEAQDRLRSALRGILKRRRNEVALVVLRPVAMGLVRCLLAGRPIDGLWQDVEAKLTWDCYEMEGKTLLHAPEGP